METWRQAVKRQRKERLELFPKLRAAESHAKVTILSFSAMHTQSMSINLSKPTPNAMKYFLVVVSHCRRKHRPNELSLLSHKYHHLSHEALRLLNINPSGTKSPAPAPSLLLLHHPLTSSCPSPQAPAQSYYTPSPPPYPPSILPLP